MQNCTGLKERFCRWRRSACAKVSTIWIVAYIFGNLLASLLKHDVSVWIRMLLTYRVSFLGQLFLSVVPILAIGLTVRFFGKNFIVFPLFLQAFIFGVSSGIACRCLSSAWWLLIPLLFFSVFVSAFLVLLFLIEWFESEKFNSRNMIQIYLVISTLLGIFNFLAISPFTRSLFH